MSFIVPAGWKPPSVFQEKRVIGTNEIHVLGLLIEHESGTQLVGSAADSELVPTARAQAELYERLSVLEAINGIQSDFSLYSRTHQPIRTLSREDTFPVSSSPAEWQYAKSNGVAWGESWDAACLSAECELFERDAILRSWFGEGVPRPIEVPRPLSDAWSSHLQLSAFQFPTTHPSIVVVGVFGFPHWPEVPFIFGFSARPTLDSALSKAYREWQQRLAFLWGEAVQGDAYPFSPTAEYHQEIYLPHEKIHVIKDWLRGNHFSGKQVSPRFQETAFVEVTHDKYRELGHAVKAVNPNCYPLLFGRAPYSDITKSQITLLHPIG